MKAVDGGETLAVVARDGLADGARRDISLIVDRQDQAVVIFLEVLFIWVAPHFSWPGLQVVAVRPVVPATGPRIGAAAIGHIRAEQLILIGDDDDLVVGTGGERPQSLLACLPGGNGADIVAAAAGDVLIFARVDDIGAEPRRPRA